MKNYIVTYTLSFDVERNYNNKKYISVEIHTFDENCKYKEEMGGFEIVSNLDYGWISIEIYDDAFNLFSSYPEVFQMMSKIEPDIKIDEYPNILEGFGFLEVNSDYVISTKADLRNKVELFYKKSNREQSLKNLVPDEE